ncbi:MAG: right-handed parallel beta-helix repeat-containing protein [Thermoleophilia bacterium]|nr:right-handed parallel beta-helix repeat-containing protein [Thermoleophilia bacterium]
MPAPRRALIGPALLAVLALPAAAAADPGPGQVEVRDDAGAVVGAPITGADALQAGVTRVRTTRAGDIRRYEVVAGAGTYGDVNVDLPNMTVRALPGAVVTISGTGGANGTGGGCVDVRRGGVVVEGLICRAPSGRGVEVNPPAAEGGVVVRAVTVDRPGQDGVAVLGGAGVLIEGVQVTSPRLDGIRLQTLTGAGPYRVSGGAVRLAGDDGIDLVDDVQRLEVGGVTIDGSRDNGVESDDAGSSDVLVSGVQIARSADMGVLLGGGGLRLTVQDSQVTESGDYGVHLGRGSGIVLRGLRLDGTNARGDLRFTTETRAGGVYERLDLAGSALDLPGEPRGVIVSAVGPARRARLPGPPAGLVGIDRLAAVKDTGAGTSSVTLRFGVSDAERQVVRVSGLGIFEDDPPANSGAWQRMAATVVDAAGNARVALGDRDIASGSDTRTAVYGLFGPPNGAPEILDVFPAPGGVARGRTVLLAARVRDDAGLSTGSFALTLDGTRRGGVSYRDGVVRFRIPAPAPGRRTARLLVVDAQGLRSEREWSFRVANARPRILARGVRPRGGARVAAGRVTLLVPVRDDRGTASLRAAVRVDGRRVGARIVRGRVVARVTLAPGRHRLQVLVTDRSGARAGRTWSVVARPR